MFILPTRHYKERSNIGFYYLAVVVILIVVVFSVAGDAVTSTTESLDAVLQMEIQKQ